ncbi:MAG: HlyD family efflux transporter periplasmic adaptor subunit [Planctomycetota bacterium]
MTGIELRIKNYELRMLVTPWNGNCMPRYWVKKLFFRRLWLAGGGLVCLVALITLWRQHRQETTLLAPPPPPDDKNVLHEIGSIEALSETAVLTRFAGDIVWMIEEGTFAEAGEPVVRFETKTVEEDIEGREKELLDKKENVLRAQADIDTTGNRSWWLIRQQEIALAVAELNRKRIYDFPDPDEKLDVELTLKSATLELQQGELDLKSIEDLARRDYVSKAQLKKKQLEVAIQKTNYVKAKLLYDLAVQGSTNDVKRVADLAVADARKRLQVTKFNQEADLIVCQANLELAQLALANSERDLSKKRQVLKCATVQAPARGRVAFTDVWKGNSKTFSPIQVGESRTKGSDICTICDTSVFRIRVWINEADISRVRLKQRATVKLASFPEQTLEAIVSDIGVVATEKNGALSSLALRSMGEAFVNVVQVKLNFVNLAEAVRKEMRIGYTADVYLHLDNTLAQSNMSATEAKSATRGVAR